jgi:uncharacterized protein YktB (UPF0637 family)
MNRQSKNYKKYFTVEGRENRMKSIRESAIELSREFSDLLQENISATKNPNYQVKDCSKDEFQAYVILAGKDKRIELAQLKKALQTAEKEVINAKDLSIAELQALIASKVELEVTGNVTV